MADASIPIDLFNPGQVFACLGLVEAADLVLGNAAGAFEWNDSTVTRFRLRADGERNPVLAILHFLSEAEVQSTVPARSEKSTGKWGIASIVVEGDVFPFPDPSSPATLPALLTDSGGRRVVIDHWGDWTQRDNVKFWAGSGGYPGAALIRDSLELIRSLPVGAEGDPFSVSATQSSSLRFDWRRDYVPLDAGFSPNEHADVVMRGYPFVEILAAIGLTNARPFRVNKLEYRYSVIGASYDSDWFFPPLLRAALGGGALPFPTRTFRMNLAWPGKENQARCITTVIEETTG